MREPLPTVEILRRTAHGAYLAWDDSEPRAWTLPQGVTLTAGPPAYFGFQVRRRRDGFEVQVRWNERRFHWRGLSRDDLLRGDLSELLIGLGVDLWSLLEVGDVAHSHEPLSAA